MPGIILMLLGLMCGAIFNVFRCVPNPKTVLGKIVSIETGKTMDSDGTNYWAYIEYYVDAVPYVIKSNYKSNFHTGDKMRVTYNEEQPQQAFLAPQFKDYIIMAGFIIAGIVVFFKTILK